MFGAPIVSFLLGAISTYLMLMFIYPINSPTEISQIEIAEQNSVIKEQALPRGGAASILDRDITYPFPQTTVYLIVESKSVAEIEENTVSPYADIINSLTEEEKELICKITWLEAGNQEEEGQRAVIEVILNRLQSDNFPNTVYEVLSQSSQFSTWCNRNKVTDEQVEQIMAILEIVCNEEETVLTEEYLYFDGKKHDYATNYIQIQDHWFGTDC